MQNIELQFTPKWADRTVRVQKSSIVSLALYLLPFVRPDSPFESLAMPRVVLPVQSDQTPGWMGVSP
jgi:hypothetical protein